MTAKITLVCSAFKILIKMPEYKDLSNNEPIPLESRVKHLEREASFVRDYVLNNDVIRAITLVCSVLALIFSVVSLLK